MKKLESDTIVVGAGIIGMAIALELARSGRVVHVLERESGWAPEASGAGAGMLAPQHEADGPGPFLDLSLRAVEIWREMADWLKERTTIDPGYRADGFLHLALSGDEFATYTRRAEWQAGMGLPVEVLDPGQTAGRFSMVSREIAGALFYEGDHQVHTARAMEAMASACRAEGVYFLFEEEVNDLVVQTGPAGMRVAGVHTPRLHASAEHTVLAAGAWTGRLTAMLGAPLPIEPVRGQALVVPVTEALPPCLVGSSLGYLVPRDGTELLAGATTEHVGYDRSTSDEGIASVWEAACRMLPGLEGTRPSQRWAGLRPGSPDGLPIMGPLPDVKDLWVAGGHYRNGILLGPLTGRIMAAWIESGDPGLDPTPFLPDRFLF